MAKKIQGEDGKTYVEKKPFYKRVWFWLVIVVLVFIGFGMAGSKDDNGGTKVSHKEATSKNTKKVNYYKIGDSVKVRDVIYTLKSVEVVSERNEFADDQPKHVIKVVYHVKNNSDKDIAVGADLDAYGPDNNKLKSYPVSDNTLGFVAAGKEMDVVDGFGTDKLGNIELQFAPLVSTAKAAKFKVKVKDTANTASESTTSSYSQPARTQQQPTQQNVQARSSVQSTDSSHDTLSNYVNQYGESPAATKVKEGMSQEEALKSTPDNMKTSGELQQEWLNEHGQ